MKPTKTLLLFAVAVAFYSCKTPSKTNETAEEPEYEVVVYNNPPAEGFDIDGSNPIAILLADKVMNAMGGRAKWDETNVLYWSFFGRRTLLWDKANNRVRIDIPETKEVLALDMNDDTGKVWQDGEEITDPDQLSQHLNRAKKIWINDSYWLVMPFKLKDSGVRLTYLREDTTLAGEQADVIGLTFKEVGVTPNNEYEVWISTEDRLVKQWAYFREMGSQEPDFVLPWNGYEDYNGLLLASGRGERNLSNIRVMSEVPAGSFDSPEALQFLD